MSAMQSSAISARVRGSVRVSLGFGGVGILV